MRGLRTSQEARDGELMTYFCANWIEVDGIEGSSSGIYPNLMFDIKGYHNSSGPAEYIHSEEAMWDSPYMPLSYSEGEIDEFIFVWLGIIIGKNNVAYQIYYDQAKKAEFLRQAR